MTELITYDTIRKAHRAEKSEIALQKLPENFLALVRGWLDHKQSMQKSTSSLLEIENAKGLLDDLINRRQKKIVIAALHTVRGDVPPKNMALDEEKFFDGLVNSLRQFRQDLREQMFGYDSIVQEKLESAKTIMEEMKNGTATDNIALAEEKSVADFNEISGKPAESAENNTKDDGKAAEIANETARKPGNITKLRLVADMPSFVDSEMKTYGPFKAGAVAELPDEMAQILISRKAAEAV